MRHCPITPRVEEALRRGRLEEITDHQVDRCESCSAAREAHALLSRLERLSPLARCRVSAETLWWRARVVRRLQSRERRASRRPLQLVGLVLSLLPLVLVLSWVAWVGIPRLVPTDHPLFPAVLATVSLGLGPLLGWLALWLADEMHPA